MKKTYVEKKNAYEEQRLFFQRLGKIQIVTKIRNFHQKTGFGSHKRTGNLLFSSVLHNFCCCC